MAPGQASTNEELQAQIHLLQKAIDDAKRQPVSPYRRTPAHQRHQAPYLYSQGINLYQNTRRHQNLTLVNKDSSPSAVKQHAPVKSTDAEKYGTSKSAKTQAARQPMVASAVKHTLDIDGLKFRVSDDGSKLFRVPDEASADKETPKRATVANVVFVRTVHGNLARASVATHPSRSTKHIQCQNFGKNGIGRLPAVAVQLASAGCAVRPGICSFGPDCRFGHDPNKVAICKTFLLSGNCANGEHCNLSHTPSYHNTPACAHFLRGNCTNDACRYPHVYVSTNAPVCRAFAVGGYCSKGPECDRRHANECPDFSNKGVCADRDSGRCRLPHVEHAKVIRRKEAREMKAAAGEELTDVSSDEEMTNDVDSDVPEEDMAALVEQHGKRNELAQQRDYVPFG